MKKRTLTGAKTWQNDLWLEIIEAATEGRQPQYGSLKNFHRPAISRYGATTPPLLKWFKGFNGKREYCENVKPFGFLQVMQPNRENEHLKPVSTYSANQEASIESCFDRATGELIDTVSLKTYLEALAQYHLRPESKFRNADYINTGITERRDIIVESITHIGKEANKWEEQSVLGVDANAQIEYGFSREEYEERLEHVRERIKKTGVRAVADAAGLSHRYVSDIQKGIKRPSKQALRNLEKAIGI